MVVDGLLAFCNIRSRRHGVRVAKPAGPWTHQARFGAALLLRPALSRQSQFCVHLEGVPEMPCRGDRMDIFADLAANRSRDCKLGRAGAAVSRPHVWLHLYLQASNTFTFALIILSTRWLAARNPLVVRPVTRITARGKRTGRQTNCQLSLGVALTTGTIAVPPTSSLHLPRAWTSAAPPPRRLCATKECVYGYTTRLVASVGVFNTEVGHCINRL